MTGHNRSLGGQGEQAALDFLEGQGISLIARNVVTPYGELDLVMKDEEVLVVVEVKARRQASQGAPQETVNAAKLEHIVRSAEHHFVETRYHGPWRIDVVAVSGSQIEHIQNVTLA